MRQYQVVLQDGRSLFLYADLFDLHADGVLEFQNDDSESIAVFPHGAWAYVLRSGASVAF